MLTLTYGYKKPEDGDWGSVFWDALAFDIQRVNDHNHDGSNSPSISAGSFSVSTQSIDNANWVLVGAGVYRQLLTMPGLFTYDTRNISFRKATTGEILYLDTLKAAANTYYVYSNDNTLDAVAIYT